MSAWEVWKMFTELTPTLRTLAASHEDISEEHMQSLRSLSNIFMTEQAASQISMEGKSCSKTKTRSLASIPPTRGTLVNHGKIAVFQGGLVWPHTCLKEPVLQCPSQGMAASRQCLGTLLDNSSRSERYML